MSALRDLKLKRNDDESVVDDKVKDKLGISLLDMKQAVSLFAKNNASKIADDVYTLMPRGEYDNLLENIDDITSFIKDKCSDPNSWALNHVRAYPDDIIGFEFLSNAVENETIEGVVFVSTNGKIKHVFIQYI